MLSNDLARALDPVKLAQDVGIQPDPWQVRFLRSPAKRKILCCSRQAGKSTVAGLLAAHGAVYEPGCLQLILAPAARQSIELLRHVKEALQGIGHAGEEVERDNVTEVEFASGSRLVALPGQEGTVRTYSSVRRLIVDEASRVPDDLYRAVRPMLAVSGGELDALSTPFGKRGWYHKEWSEGGPAWERYEVPATECPRISAEFLAEERQALGELWYLQEYCCRFVATNDAAFDYDLVRDALTDSVVPLWAPGETPWDTVSP